MEGRRTSNASLAYNPQVHEGGSPGDPPPHLSTPGWILLPADAVHAPHWGVTKASQDEHLLQETG